MTIQADQNKDIQAKLVAYADGHDSTATRVVSNSVVSVNIDLILLRSERWLGLKSYPILYPTILPQHTSRERLVYFHATDALISSGSKRSVRTLR